MPEIPLFQGGQQAMLPALPGPVLDRERRPRVDAGGTISGLEQVKRSAGAAVDASMEPLMPLDTFAGEARGIEALAGGLQDFSRVMQDLNERRQEAKDYADIADAETSMDQTLADYSKFQMENPGAPETWEPEWTRRFEQLNKTISENEKYSPQVKLRLRAALQRFGVSSSIRVSTDATKATFRRGAEAGEAKFQSFAKVGDRNGMVSAAAEIQQFTGVAPEVYAARIQDAMRTWAHGEANNRFKTASMNGDAETMEYALAFGKQEAGWSDSDVEYMRVQGMRTIADVKETNFNKAESDLLGQMIFDKASGAVILPSQVEGMVQAGKLSPKSASAFMAAVKHDSRPLPGEWGDLMDSEVVTYDQDEDPKLEKLTSLRQKVIALNPDPAQLAQFNSLLEKAIETNSDAGKKADTYALVAARNEVRDAYAKSGIKRAWSKDLELALQDTAKLQAFGIPKEKAEEIKALMQGGQIANKTVTPDYNAAYRAFRQQATTRKGKSESNLTEWEYNLFEQAANAGEDGNIEDPVKQRESQYEEATVLNAIDVWFSAETKNNKGIRPDATAVKKKVGEMLNGALQGRAIRTTLPKAAAVDSSHRITSYGYKSDEWGDSKSLAGIGAFVPSDEQAKIRRGEASTYKLRENDFAVSPDVEAKLVAAGVKPGDTVKMKLEDGTFISGRWMDRTADDDTAKSLGLSPLRGRWDLYSPKGKSARDGARVVGFETN